MKHHSTLSRRDFMKALGLGAAGVGAATAVAPAISDVDDLISRDTSSALKKAWWVKEKDEPTVEMDWDEIKRFNGRRLMNSPIGRYYWMTDAEIADMSAKTNANEKAWMTAAKPGYTHKDYALYVAAIGGDAKGVLNYSWVGPQNCKTAETLGMPKWSASPEENTKMLRQALRFFGAADIGVLKLDSKAKNLIYTRPREAPYWEYVFEDVEKGYQQQYDTPKTYDDDPPVLASTPAAAREIGGKWVIPNNADLYLVTIAGQSSLDGFSEAPSWLQRAAADNTIRLNCGILNCAQEFLRALGYQCLCGHERNALCSAPAAGILSGVGELSRNGQMLTPDYGLMVRATRFLTDLPLAPTKPIDAGMWKFCQTCALCAHSCPSGAIEDGKEPNWDQEGWNVSGKKDFKVHAVKCQVTRNTMTRDCGMCMAACVFSKKDFANIHQIIKTTVSTTPLFNGFFTNMDEFFGYGIKSGLGGDQNPLNGQFNEEAPKWWDKEILQFGVNTTIGM